MLEIKDSWHSLSVEDVLKKVKSRPNGLSEKEASDRLQRFGLNKLPEEKPISKIKIFFEQFKSPLIYILVIAGIVTLVLQDWTDSVVIFAAVFLNSAIGYFQESKTSQILSKLRKIVRDKAIVIRNSQEKEINQNQITVGDIIVLQPGDKIPADARLIENLSLKINESVLTGEWLAADKSLKKLPAGTYLADRENMVYMGTIIESGRGKAVVVVMGIHTEIGKIAASLQELNEEKTPYQKKISKFSKIVAIVVGIVCLVIFVGGIITGRDLLEMFVIAVAVAVGAIPEGLPVAITVILALGMERILRERGLVRRLIAAEVLGSTSVICVPGDTLIWTNSSIKPISLVKKGDKVLGSDKKFSEVKKIYKRKYSGELIKIKPVGLPEIEITPEHPILVARSILHRPVVRKRQDIRRPRVVELTKAQWIPASEIKKGDLVLVPRIKRRDSSHLVFKRGKKRTKTSILLDEELSELLGWYLAEGCTSKNKIIFYLGKHELFEAQRIRELIKRKLKLESYLYEKKTALQIVVTNVDLARLFKKLFGRRAIEKKIPEFIFWATHKDIIHFIRGYLAGDGCIDNYTLRFSTASKTLAHQLILLLAKIGIRGRVFRNKIRKGNIRERIINTTDSYSIFINGSQADIICRIKKNLKYKKQNLVLKNQNFVYFPIQSVSKEKKSIEVFNIETESQTYCLPFVVHNCTDKTGTLTQAKMQVTDVFADSKKFPYALALKITMLCNEAFIENIQDPMHKWIIRGRPTEKALLLAALQSGLRKEKIEKEEPRIDILAFDPVYKYSASLHQLSQAQDILYVLGAPEIILEKSSHFETDKGTQKMTKRKKEELTKKFEELDSQGLRLVAAAYQKIGDKSLALELQKESEIRELSETDKQKLYEKHLKDMVFVAFISLKDPLRTEVRQAIETCKRAGMRPIIITGDHPLTAKAVAEEIGIPVESKNIIKGDEFEKLSDEEFKKRLKDITIYARMEPQQKLRIVGAWQERGEIVAMTGDGVNDAPALKRADIGVALGSGTDVAKEASDLILLTDDFSVIILAVKEGRTIIDNIKKTVTLQVSQSFSEIILIGASIIGGLPLPILPAQILWENLIEGSPQGIALAFEPKEKDIMERKPEDSQSSLLNQEIKAIIFGFGIVTSFILFGLFLWLYSKSLPIAEIRTVIFAVLAVDSIFYAFSCKNLRKNIWQYNIFSNLYLIGSMFFSFFMLAVAIYIPLFQKILKTVPLNLFDWTWVVGLGIINLVLIEIIKFFFIKKKKV